MFVVFVVVLSVCVVCLMLCFFDFSVLVIVFVGFELMFFYLLFAFSSCVFRWRVVMCLLCFVFGIVFVVGWIWSNVNVNRDGFVEFGAIRVVFVCRCFFWCVCV